MKEIWPPAAPGPPQKCAAHRGIRSHLVSSKFIVIGPMFGHVSVWPMYALISPAGLVRDRSGPGQPGPFRSGPDIPNILATTIPMATDSRLTKLIPHGGLSQFGLGGPRGSGRVGGSMGYGGDIGSPPPAHPPGISRNWLWLLAFGDDAPPPP